MPEARFTHEWLKNALKPRAVHGPPVSVDRVVTDTRADCTDALFAALSGERHDAHDHLDGAVAAGARVLLVSRREGLDVFVARHPALSVFLVDDTLHALGQLAAAWLAACAPRVIGITGSNGKTTVKEMTAAICAAHGSVLKTEGNFNNLIGLPLTVLALRDEKTAVLEMGMNQHGEIARLCEIAPPHVAVITLVADAHLEGLKDIHGVMRAKGEIFEALADNGLAVVNLDNPYTVELARTRLAPRNIRVLGVSLHDPKADLLATRIEPLEDGYRVEVRAEGRPVEVTVPLPGHHNVINALCAMAAASGAGIGYEQMAGGLARCTLPGRRLKIRHLGGWTVIDDCYNANPSSMRAALELLVQRRGSGRAVAVLGDMLELGEQSARLHRELGELAAKLSVDLIGSYGVYSTHLIEAARGAGLCSGSVLAASDMDTLTGWLGEVLQPGDVVLVKGSRGARMERVLDALETLSGEAG